MSRRETASGLLQTGLILALLQTTGCSLFAGKADYADYREIRLASDPGTRAVAMSQYIARHPHGAWSDEVSAARKRDELHVFESGKDTRAGLEHYLQAYPDGTFTEQAQSRLRAAGLIEAQRTRVAAQDAELSNTRKARAEELRRTWISRFIQYWVATLGEIQGWGEPIADVAEQNPDFSRAFGALPRPRCTRDECVKYYTSEYAVPVPGGTRIERSVSLLLRLRMRSGTLERAELLLPERGFSRWYEIETRQPVDDADREARAAVVNWAIQRTLASLDVLSEPLKPVAGATLPSIVPPAIGPSGERIDTSIETPSDPQQHLLVPDNAGIGVNARAVSDPSAAQPEPASSAPPDLTFEPLGVGRQGQRVEVPAADASAPSSQDAGAALEMLFSAPLDVPKQRAQTATTAPRSGKADLKTSQISAQIRPVVRALQSQALRLSVFAAGSAGPAYDGLVIEHIKGKRTKP